MLEDGEQRKGNRIRDKYRKEVEEVQRGRGLMGFRKVRKYTCNWRER